MNSPKEPSPSEERRKRLNDELNIPEVSSFFPIKRYYEGADKLYDTYQQAFRDKQIDTAYVYGKRYCRFCVDSVPTHAYYKAPENIATVNRHNSQVDKVLSGLETIKKWMDEEEIEKERQRELIEDQQRTAKLESFQQHVQKQHEQRSMPSASSEQIQQSALSKLASLRHSNNGVHSQYPQMPQQRSKKDPSGEEPMGPPTSRYRILDDDSGDEDGSLQPLPPPLPPPDNAIGSPPLPLPPPSYHTIASRRGFLSPSKIHPAPPPPISLKKVSMAQLIQQYKQLYMDFHQAGRIRMTPIPSYQGRKTDSTNGCTVISALCAAYHLRRDIDTDTIVRIIDQDCVPILKQIRSKLGLGAGALIIPSDVHDHLVDHKILQQENFEGAAGGNIMDPNHFGAFIKLLACGDSGNGTMQKAAATLFFREHVVSIVKLTGGGKSRFDLIDSLPGITNNGRPMATRTHCHDMESLEVLLKWYCSRKFSEANCTYIDRNNEWDDTMADFDPRVFQGFVWMLHDKKN
jgi:hypothetical protein